MGLLEEEVGSIVVTVGSHMGATDPSYHVSYTAVEVQECSGSHTDSFLIDFSFRVPGGGVPSGTFEWNVPIFV